MRRLLIFTLMILSIQCHAAIKDDGTELIVFGSHSNPFSTPTSYTQTFRLKAVANPSSSSQQTIMNMAAGAGPGADLEFNWNHGSSSYEDTCTKASDFPIANITPVVGGVWYSIACVWTGTRMQSYLNGVLVQDVASSAAAGAGGGVVGAMGYFPSRNKFSDGTIAEIAYYQNIILTAQEIMSIASGVTPIQVRKPTVYSPMWGADIANDIEADLSGALSNAGNVATGTYFNASGTSHAGLTIVPHAPVGPFVREEEGSY